LKSKTCTSRSTVPLLARYGVTATCRASFALYNTKDEVDTLAESTVKAREFLMSDDTPTIEKPAEGAQPAPAGKPSALPEAEIARLTDEIVTALKTVYDPEIPADIYEIGLIWWPMDSEVKVKCNCNAKGRLETVSQSESTELQRKRGLENGFRARAGFEGAEVGFGMSQIPHVFPQQNHNREPFATRRWRSE
jgi:hypothetical protein